MIDIPKNVLKLLKKNPEYLDKSYYPIIGSTISSVFLSVFISPFNTTTQRKVLDITGRFSHNFQANGQDLIVLNIVSGTVFSIEDSWSLAINCALELRKLSGTWVGVSEETFEVIPDKLQNNWAGHEKISLPWPLCLGEISRDLNCRTIATTPRDIKGAIFRKKTSASIPEAGEREIFSVN